MGAYVRTTVFLKGIKSNLERIPQMCTSFYFWLWRGVRVGLKVKVRVRVKVRKGMSFETQDSIT
jgi:hypothetical protein